MCCNKIKKVITAAAVITMTATTFADSETFNVHTRVGNGFHMYSTVTLTSNGTVDGKTQLKNWNNVKGFTGGVFVVALDENNNAVYTTDMHSFGINAAFFRKYRTRNVSWSAEIPQEYLARTTKIAVMQVHNPSYRVAKWVKDNMSLIISHARSISELVKKIKDKEFDVEDAVDIIDAHI